MKASSKETHVCCRVQGRWADEGQPAERRRGRLWVTSVMAARPVKYAWQTREQLVPQVSLPWLKNRGFPAASGGDLIINP